ncbi:MAG: hypothetical protein D6732_25125 [Methanobacteriota archaeon]|nr:MAG: hypothetical protein D6732_25125 [Euryarchaeota archaeon]
MLISKLLSVLFMIILVSPSFTTIPQPLSVSEKNGFGGDTAVQSDIEDCKDPALVFVHCNLVLNDLPSDGDFKGTVVVMDDGLSVTDWRELTSPLYGVDVDIVAYLTPDANGEVDIIKYDPTLPLTDSQWNDVLGYYPSDGHGREVISALGSIAKHAKVIFVNLQLGDDNIGFRSHADVVIWDWILNNVDSYDIDVISMSFNVYLLPPWNVISRILDIADKGVFMVSAIGNDGRYHGGTFPQGLPDVYAVASVDHENRYRQFGRFFQESKKGEYTGSAGWSPFTTSYGSEYNQDPSEAVDFAMPGNGVPIYVGGGRWEYAMGTSFSTPYLAASALIAVYAYNMGFRSVAIHSFSDPTPTEIYQLLRDSSSSSTSHNVYNGWGWIYLDILFENAFNLGRDVASSLGGGIF